jgi:hypothetical protein
MPTEPAAFRSGVTVFFGTMLVTRASRPCECGYHSSGPSTVETTVSQVAKKGGHTLPFKMVRWSLNTPGPKGILAEDNRVVFHIVLFHVEQYGRKSSWERMPSVNQIKIASWSGVE